VKKIVLNIASLFAAFGGGIAFFANLLAPFGLSFSSFWVVYKLFKPSPSAFRCKNTIYFPIKTGLLTVFIKSPTPAPPVGG
jgi:hypothetical protein